MRNEPATVVDMRLQVAAPSAAAVDAPRPALSVVAPCYNEEKALRAFCERMLGACRVACGDDFEIILVNDGSRDQTWPLVRALAEREPAIIGVNLARNHGHQLAVTAGVQLARGERVLIIDSDLQDPPELIVEMMSRMDEGFDVVYGRRRVRGRESRFKLVTASLFYRMLRAMSDVDIPADVGDFRLMSRRIVDRLNAMPEQDRFLRGMIAWLGGRQVELLYDRDPRHAGATGYTLAKMLRLALDGFTSFSIAPLRLATLLASFGVLAAIGLAAFVIGGFLLGKTIPGWASLALIVVFFSTAQLICLAIFGEYLGRAYMQGKQRPLFLIDEIVVHRPDAAEPAGR